VKTWRNQAPFLLPLLAALLAMAPSVLGGSKRMTPTVRAVREVLPSVVNISTERLVRRWSPESPAEEDAQHDDERAERVPDRHSLGSGIIICAPGLVMTNHHVVSRASRIHITTLDGRKFLAEEIASDPREDLALLRIEPDTGPLELKEIKFAKPDDLLLGEPTIAVGNPFGLGSSISRGVLSAINRKLFMGSQVMFADLLQTDAAINPGSSGGPLINIDAEMIGINTVVVGEAQGISFAIPLKRVENVLARWLVPERFNDDSLGLIPAARVDAQGNNVIYVGTVLPESPAARAGLKAGQVITKFNNKPIANLIDLSRELWRLKAGDGVALVMGDGRRVRMVVEKVPALDGKELAGRRLGLALQELTPSLAEALGYPFHRGLVLSEVRAQSTPGLERGEILAMLDDVRIYGFPDVVKAIQGKRHGDKVTATVIKIVTIEGRRYLARQIIALDVL